MMPCPLKAESTNNNGKVRNKSTLLGVLKLVVLALWASRDWQMKKIRTEKERQGRRKTNEEKKGGKERKE
jgi:hypothetical protein